MAECLRVAALTGYFSVMRELGANPRPLLRKVGLSPELLRDPEQLISARAALRLLELSAAATGCITLGLRMAEHRTLANLGATSLLVAHQLTLRSALRTIAEFRDRINPILVLHIEETKREALLRADLTLSSPEPARQALNLATGAIAQVCTWVLGEEWVPNMVCFSHEEPPVSERPRFRRLFRCPPEFNSQFNGIVIQTADLDRPNLRADNDLARHARRLIESVATPTAEGASRDVEKTIALLLPSARATIKTCAASMGVTVRTLQRNLEADGTSFSILLNRARKQLAAQYLSNPKMKITDIAGMLGYSSIAAFTRWHAQTFGASPREWRTKRSSD